MRILFHFALFLLVIAATGRAQPIVTLANLPSGVTSFIIQGSDGNFYGTSSSGGDEICQTPGFSGGCGSVFEITADGTVSTLYSFQPGPNAILVLPDNVVQGSDGNFYGTTYRGGKTMASCPNGCGTIFRVTPDGSGTTLYAFDQTHGSSPTGNLVEGTDGNFYGATSNGGTGANCPGGCGTIFKITPQGSLTTIYSFNLTDAASPGGLILGADGNFYGTAGAGGPGGYCPSSEPMLTLRGCGTVFKITPAGALTTIYAFEGMSDGTEPGGLIQAKDGDFYGITAQPSVTNFNGTDIDGGSIFQLTPAGVLTTMVAFNGTNGVAPNSLIQASDGNLYGTTFGQPGIFENGVALSQTVGGTLFQLSPATGTLVTLYNFCAVGCGATNFETATSVIQAKDGNLYGIAGSTFFFRYNLVSPTAPAISTSGVLNGANFQPGIGAGSWITIEGTNLSAKTDSWTIVKGVLPTTLDGVSVSVAGQSAYIEYVSPSQINAIAPGVPPGSVAVTVTTANGTSQAVNAQLAAESPAFFQWGNFAVATRQDFSLAVKNGTFPGTTTIPAKPGDVIILWGTGFGPTSPAAPAGMQTPSTTTFNTANAVSVTVGGKSTTVYGAALAPGYAGLYQVAIQIPVLANGDYPIIATINGASSPATTLITVQK